MSVCPCRAVVIEDAIDRIGQGIDGQIVQSDVAMNERSILRADRHGLVALDHLLHGTDEIVVIDDMTQPLVYPMTWLGPRDMLRKPSGHVGFGDGEMLLREDRPDRTADFPGQIRIRPATAKQNPWITSARNHLAQIEATL